MGRSKSVFPSGNEADESVGYKKPPKKHRFQPGTSGNPAGRPPGAHNFDKLLKKVLGESITVSSGGRETVMSKLAVLIRLKVKQAVAGDVAAIGEILMLKKAMPASDGPLILVVDECERYV